MFFVGENRELDDFMSFFVDLDRFFGLENGKWDLFREFFVVVWEDKM